MTTIFLILLFLLGFLAVLALQRFGGASVDTESQAPIPWIHPLVIQELTARISAFDQRRWTTKQHHQSIVTPTLIDVTASDWERIPGNLPVKAHKKTSLERISDLEQLLSKTPGQFVLRAPIWPICCNQLCILLQSQGKGLSLNHLETKHGKLDRCFLENELKTWGGPQANLQSYFATGWSEILLQIRSNKHSGQGLNFFQCAQCTRVYIGSCSP